MLNTKIDAMERDIESTYISRNSDSKSSAGDKHEVGRAMIQQELDQQEARLARTFLLLHELERIPLTRSTDRIGSGSLVETTNGIYFISIGLGKVTFDKNPVFVISQASPIGKLLENKAVGNTVTFNGREFRILSIA
ncbi:MAG: 3-oxoacyl-ACP synthase [Flavobacteriales bacterium]